VVLLSRFFMVISADPGVRALGPLQRGWGGHYIKACRVCGVAIGGSRAVRKARIIARN
jgi:hypothetical protein